MHADGTPGEQDDELRDLWFKEPEEVLRRIARKNDAEYVEGSLVFAPGGRTAEADFDTYAPGEGNKVTKLHQLAIELDALEARLMVPKELWRFFQGPPAQG